MWATASGFSQNARAPFCASFSAQALLTRMSSLPSSRPTWSNRALTWSSSAWSTRTAIPLPPGAVTAECDRDPASRAATCAGDEGDRGVFTHRAVHEKPDRYMHVALTVDYREAIPECQRAKG